MMNVLQKLTLDPAAMNFISDDFNTASTAGEINWTPLTANTASNTKVTTGVDNVTRAIGVHQLSVTNVNAVASINRDTNGILFGYATFTQKWRIMFPTLSTAAQEYVAQLGWGDQTNNVNDHTDGVYAEYNRATAGGFFRLKSANNNTRTLVTSTIPVVANTWYTIELRVNAAGNLAELLVNGVSAGTLTTNIPTTAGRQCGQIAKMIKTVGGTARTCLIDRFEESQIWTTPRSP